MFDIPAADTPDEMAPRLDSAKVRLARIGDDARDRE
jgi:hypothetical protein